MQCIAVNTYRNTRNVPNKTTQLRETHTDQNQVREDPPQKRVFSLKQIAIQFTTEYKSPRAIHSRLMPRNKLHQVPWQPSNSVVNVVCHYGHGGQALQRELLSVDALHVDYNSVCPHAVGHIQCRLALIVTDKKWGS